MKLDPPSWLSPRQEPNRPADSVRARPWRITECDAFSRASDELSFLALVEADDEHGDGHNFFVHIESCFVGRDYEFSPTDWHLTFYLKPFLSADGRLAIVRRVKAAGRPRAPRVLRAGKSPL